MRNNHKDICIVISQARSSGRGLLQGVLRFAESRPDWKVHIYEPNAYGFSETIRALHRKTTDGVLTSELEDRDFARQLERSTVPLVVIGTRRQCLPARKENLTVISFDERKIGSYAAQQALNLGMFKSFGFVGSTDAKHIALSELRAAGFRDELRNRGVCCSTPAKGEKLASWIKDLPKPTVIVGCVDDRAAEVLDTCEREGLSVPDAVRVIGIDNSETICQTTRPTLSSIATDFAEEGYAATAELDCLLRKRKSSVPRRTLHGSTRCSFVQRDSTRTLPPGLQLVKRAVDYIAAHADSNITAKMVVDHMHVSKRLLYLRFREFADKTLHETIVEKRIEVLKRRLLTSRQAIAKVTADCGFTNPTHVKTLFKKLTGCTPGEWRKRHGKSGGASTRYRA